MVKKINKNQKKVSQNTQDDEVVIRSLHLLKGYGDDLILTYD